MLRLSPLRYWRDFKKGSLMKKKSSSKKKAAQAESESIPSRNPFETLSGKIMLIARGREKEQRIDAQRILLLEQIQKTGSLSSAARACSLSYKAAWDAIQAMNNLSSKPLLISTTGGRGGGGATLTQEGLRVVEIYREMQREQERILAKFSKYYNDFEDYFRILRRISVKVSARNTLSGTVKDIQKGAVNAIVHIALKGNDVITSSITMESVKGMGLKVGQPVFAIIKATSIIIGAESNAPLKLSARNLLSGTISRVITGPVMSEVTLSLPGGNSVSAIITRESAKSTGLKEGMNAIAIFKASAVIVGIEG